MHTQERRWRFEDAQLQFNKYGTKATATCLIAAIVIQQGIVNGRELALLDVCDEPTTG